MHGDELEIDEPLVRRRLADEFPEWADLPLRRVEPAGTDNAIFRLGEELAVRLARRKGPTRSGGKEFDWLPRFTTCLTFTTWMTQRVLSHGRRDQPNCLIEGGSRSLPGSASACGGSRRRRP